MQALLDKIAAIDAGSLNYDHLLDHILPFVPEEIDYITLLPKSTSETEYARNILMMDPIEVVLIYWPPGVESAIHLHKGFWGYVGILKGSAINIEYSLKKNKMKELRSVLVHKGGIIPEPESTLHKLGNASKTEAMVSLHFYAPPLDDLGGLLLYDEEGTIYELDESAESASIDLPKEHYRSIKKDQFKLRSYKNQKSHRIYPILPKPEPEEIKRMLNDYYSSQASSYDKDEKKYRRRYVEGVNEILVQDIKRSGPLRVLDIASGTGTRALNIKKGSEADYELYAVEMNPNMRDQSSVKGIHPLEGDWLDVELEDDSFDVITWLYAFGHLCNYEERIAALEKIHRKLKTGASFYFDVFNMNDPYEWGANALKVFNEYNMDYFGYERGDVFYKKKGSDEVAFLHYFDEDKLIALLESLNFKVDWVKHVGYMKKSGELLDNNEGCILIKATKL